MHTCEQCNKLSKYGETNDAEDTFLCEDCLASIEGVTKQAFKKFCQKVFRARQLKNLPHINDYEFQQYIQVLINGATAIQTLNTSQCNDRYDLVDPETEYATLLEKRYKIFVHRHLGLELVINGDARGVAFKLVVDRTLGDSFGDGEHLCVPQINAAICFV